MALVRKDAALIVKDADAQAELMGVATGLIRDAARLEAIGRNAEAMALPNAAALIIDEAYKLAG